MDANTLRLRHLLMESGVRIMVTLGNWTVTLKEQCNVPLEDFVEDGSTAYYDWDTLYAEKNLKMIPIRAFYQKIADYCIRFQHNGFLSVYQPEVTCDKTLQEVVDILWELHALWQEYKQMDALRIQIYAEAKESVAKQCDEFLAYMYDADRDEKWHQMWSAL